MSDVLQLLEKHAAAQHERGTAIMAATAKLARLQEQAQGQRGAGNLLKAQALDSQVYLAEQERERAIATAVELDKVEQSAICARSGEILASLRADVDLAEVVLVGALNAGWAAAQQSMLARKRLSEVSSAMHNWSTFHSGAVPVAEIRFVAPSGEHSVPEPVDYWPKCFTHFATRVEQGVSVPMDLADYRRRERARTAPSPMGYRSGDQPPMQTARRR
ncbi:MAG: hypothetical protein MUQ30_21125 [Anaerolineae bacterium]|nr:hypothetical protein [Anaerolineae bacterium]